MNDSNDNPPGGSHNEVPQPSPSTLGPNAVFQTPAAMLQSKRTEPARRFPEHRPALYRVITIGATAAVAMLTYFILPASIDELQRRMICIFIVAALFWATEALPLFATSLMVIGMQILFLAEKGGLAEVLPRWSIMPNRVLDASQFLETFGSNIIILFMGGFLLAAALTKHGIDRAIASRLLQPFMQKPFMLLCAVMGITAFLSMWMSNTATAAMMLAIITPLLKQLPDGSKFSRALVLAVPFGANIGGVGTPIGSPPNAVAFGAIQAAGGEGMVTFLRWMMFGVPLALVMLIMAAVLLYLSHRPRQPIEFAPIDPPRKLSRRGVTSLLILGATVVLWLTGEAHGLKSGVVALFAAAALTSTGVLDRHDVDRIDWNILLLMWGGLALGEGMQASGLVDLVADVNLASLGAGWLIAAVLVAIAVALSTVMSNTAAANLLVPIAMALSTTGVHGQAELAILCALGCSFAMALPVSTPPNAIAFSTGRIPAASLLKLGGLISLASVALMLVGYRFVFAWVLPG